MLLRVCLRHGMNHNTKKQRKQNLFYFFSTFFPCYDPPIETPLKGHDESKKTQADTQVASYASTESNPRLWRASGYGCAVRGFNQSGVRMAGVGASTASRKDQNTH